MKILFLNVPMQGHINPTLPLVQSLVENGHEVHYYCDASSGSKISGRGAVFRDYGIAFDGPDPLTNPTMVTGAKIFLELALESLDKFLAEWRVSDFDLIIHDSCAYAGIVASKELGVPALNSTTTLFYTPQIVLREAWDIASKDFLRSLFVSFSDWLKFFRLAFRAKFLYGLLPSTLEVVTCPGKVNVAYTAKEIQPHSSILNDESYKYIGSVVEPRPKDESFPIAALAKGRVIYISLGTIYTKNIEFFQNCIKALANMPDLTVVISLGPDLDKADLGPLPDRYIVKPFVPQLEVLAKADVFISHGGTNSLNEALSFGVPMVLCPQQGEQLTASRSFERKGLAISTGKRDPNADEIRHAVERILADREYSKRTRRATGFLKRALGLKGAVDLIETLVPAVD